MVTCETLTTNSAVVRYVPHENSKVSPGTNAAMALYSAAESSVIPLPVAP